MGLSKLSYPAGETGIGFIKLPRWPATERPSLKKGLQRGRSPPLELDYIIPSPSRTAKVRIIALVPLREGVSERQWRSAANRPSRQARRGWAPQIPPTRQARRGWAFYGLPSGWHNSAPPMGAQVPGGHRSAPTEPAGETLSPQATERPFLKKGVVKGGASPLWN